MLQTSSWTIQGCYFWVNIFVEGHQVDSAALKVTPLVFYEYEYNYENNIDYFELFAADHDQKSKARGTSTSSPRSLRWRKPAEKGRRIHYREEHWRGKLCESERRNTHLDKHAGKSYLILNAVNVHPSIIHNILSCTILRCSSEIKNIPTVDFFFSIGDG